MSRFHELLDKYQDQEETDAEVEELARLLKEDDGRARTFYDALMLEVDLYESYAGISRIQAAPKRRWRPRQWVLAWAVAALVLIGLVGLLRLGSVKEPGGLQIGPGGSGNMDGLSPRPIPNPKGSEPSPVPSLVPKPPEPPPDPTPKKPPEEDDNRPGHKEREKEKHRSEAESEYQKGLKEVQRKTEQGKTKEAEDKLREIQRERDKKLNGRERHGDD
jgi:hypothetical protein